LLRAYKTELHPTKEQAEKIDRTIGTCRYVYNLYIAENKGRYEKKRSHQQSTERIRKIKDAWAKNDPSDRRIIPAEYFLAIREERMSREKAFISGMDFSKWLNHAYIPENPDKSWIREASSKAVKKSIMNAEAAYKKFFAKKAGFPEFKKKGVTDPKMYFVKTDRKAVIRFERHRIKIPTLGWVRLKEKGYIPKGAIIKSGTVSRRAGRYYVSVLCELDDRIYGDAHPVEYTEGIGIDLGIKEFAVLSTGKAYHNINRRPEVRRLEKKLKREQRSLSRKHESYKKRGKGKEKGGETTRQNIQKSKVKIQRICLRLDNIRSDYINKTVSEIVRTKPSYICIEDLNVSGMMKNRHLAGAISRQKFYEFRTKLIQKAKREGIEVRIADRMYPSSKRCSCCGNIKKDLKLSDRIYKCERCGMETDRDLNAGMNLRDAKDYKIA